MITVSWYDKGTDNEQVFIRASGKEDIEAICMIFNRALNTLDGIPPHIQKAHDEIRGFTAHTPSCPVAAAYVKK